MPIWGPICAAVRIRIFRIKGFTGWAAAMMRTPVLGIVRPRTSVARGGVSPASITVTVVFGHCSGKMYLMYLW